MNTLINSPSAVASAKADHFSLPPATLCVALRAGRPPHHSPRTLLRWRLAVVLFALASFGLLPGAQAVNPPPEGGYPGFNTAEGQNALLSLDVTNGFANTAVGWFSLSSNIEGDFNTATGAGALLFNTADENTAFGAAALLFNTIGDQNTAVGAAALLNNTEGSDNTAVGFQALQANTEGNGNTAVGDSALFSNTTGDQNTAIGNFALASNTAGDRNTATGVQALFSNTTGFNNTANGDQALSNNTEGNSNTATGILALFSNTTGIVNTANGAQALFSNTTGTDNTAIGYTALYSNITGDQNTAIGNFALASNIDGDANTAIGLGALANNDSGVANTAIGINALFINSAGESNVAVGNQAGANQTGGGGNVYIGAGMTGVAGENNTTYIRNVHNSSASARQVYVDSDNQIGTLASTRRVKDDIEPMDKVSETILALRPVTFRYKKEIDRYCAPQFGLVAEEVAEVNPDLVTRDTERKPETVRYDAVNAMLLNEFLKEHKKVKEQEATIAELKRDFQMVSTRQQEEIQILSAQLKEQAAQIQKVSAQVQMSKPTTKVVLKKP